MDIVSRGHNLVDIVVTGETDLTLGLAQNKGIIAGMGGMAGLTFAVDKRRMTMLLLLLPAHSLMTGQTELTAVHRGL